LSFPPQRSFVLEWGFFWSYFRGKESLFNDRFEGDDGSCFYEQIPLAEKRRGLGGKLEGLLDGAWKVFGV